MQSNKIEDGRLVITEKTIDIREVIRSKNPNLLRVIPWFLIRYLKRIIHQDQLNEALYKYREKHGIEFVESIINMFGANITIEGAENLLESERILVASNHPLGGLDGLALIHSVAKHRMPIRFPVNDLLLFLPNLRELFIPVNKHGRHSADAARQLDDVFKSNDTILFFPAGLASRKIKGKIVDLEWKKTFIQKSRQYQRDIVPTFISGHNSKFFYGLARFRKFFRIKANLEMLYLVDEMYKQYNKNLIIRFGEPIPWQTFDKSKSDKEWALYIKEIVYANS